MKLLTIFLFALSSQAQLTTISQYVANGDGSPFMGEVTIQVPPFASRSFAVRSRDIWLCSSANIITGCAQQIVNGVLTVQLLPNGGGSPSGTSYFVSYYPDVPPGRRPSVKTEYWVVPTGGPFTIDQVKTSTPPVPSVQISPTQLNQTGYTTGQFPCIVGGTFLPCSSAGGVWGSITGTLSNQTDLNTALSGKAPASAGIQFVTSDPSGSCTVGVQMQYNSVSGKLWGCAKNGAGGIWAKMNTSPIPTSFLTLSLAGLGTGNPNYALPTDGSGQFNSGCWMIDLDGDGFAVGGGIHQRCLWFSDGVGEVFSGNTIFVDSGGTIRPSGGVVWANKVILQPGAQPACNSANRGQQWYVAGATGVQDSFSICAKDAADVYAWRVIY